MNENELKIIIHQAFPSKTVLTHEDCMELSTKLSSLVDEDVKEMIGLVLIDLMNNANKSSKPFCWADSVVRFLCSASPPPIASIARFDYGIKEMSDYSLSQQSEAKRLFNQFSAQQSYAIYNWLLVSANWRNSGIDASELDAAINYWCHQSNELVRANHRKERAN